MLRDIFAFDENYYQREIIDSPVCRTLNTCRMQRKYTVSSKRGQNTAPKLESNSQITTYVRYNAYVAAYMLHLLVIFKKTRLAHRKCEKRSKISNSITFTFDCHEVASASARNTSMFEKRRHIILVYLSFESSPLGYSKKRIL